MRLAMFLLDKLTPYVPSLQRKLNGYVGGGLSKERLHGRHQVETFNSVGGCDTQLPLLRRGYVDGSPPVEAIHGGKRRWDADFSGIPGRGRGTGRVFDF